MKRCLDVYNEYAGRVKALRASIGCSAASDPFNDPFYGAYNELIAEYKDRLLGRYTEDEFDTVSPHSDWCKEVAALYEACYTKAKEMQHARRENTDGASQALESSNLKALVMFPWRLAEVQLCDMKERALRREERSKQRQMQSRLRY